MDKNKNYIIGWGGEEIPVDKLSKNSLITIPGYRHNFFIAKKNKIFCGRENGAIIVEVKE